MRLPSLAIAVALVSLPASAGTLIDPPPEFDHPFAGEVVIHHLPYRPLFGPISAARRNHLLDGRRGYPVCEISLPDESEVGTQMRERLFRIERANCNGWAARDGDVNWRH